MKIYFSDFFSIPSASIEQYGAFNISLLSDLPLFIDPFLLFNSKKPEYQDLHDRIVTYLRFLKDKSSNQSLEHGLLKALYAFPEISENWLGFTVRGNRGRGLGSHFANALHKNLYRLFKDFGDEDITKGSHLEKLCLIEEGVGKDSISDFTTNLIKEYLLEYTEAFALKFVRKGQRKKFLVPKVRFNQRTETWEDRRFVLPRFEKDFVLLTPKDMLTKDSTWINKDDLLDDFEMVRESVPNDALRAQVNNYFMKILPDEASGLQRRKAALKTIRRFPQLINAFIRYKERRPFDRAS